jgi:predicted phosphodiesterase
MCDYTETILIASDAHADPKSLAKLFSMTEARSKISKRIFLGDAIGYGDDPVSVIEQLKQFDVCIRGNHELLALEEVSQEGYSKSAAGSIGEHVRMIGPEGLSFLKGFRPRYELGNCMYYHGTPDSAMDYPFNEVDIRDILEKHPDHDMFFGGHLHIPRLAVVDRITGAIQFEDIAGSQACFQLDLDKNKYVINCPSATPGRFGYAIPGCCLLRTCEQRPSTLEFLFLRQ